MGKLVKFHFKRILLSPFFLVSCILVCALFLALECYNDFLHYSAYGSYIDQFAHYEYLEIVLIAISFCIAVFYYRQKSQLEEMCFFSKAEIAFSKIVATTLCSLQLCALPLLYVIGHAALEHTQLDYTVGAAVYGVSIWAMIILGSQSIAFLCTQLFDSSACYILCLPFSVLLSYLNSYLAPFFLLDQGIKEKILNLICVAKSGYELFPYTGARLDSFFGMKFLSILGLFLLALSLVWMVNETRRGVSVLLTLFLLIAEVGCCFGWGTLYPEYGLEEDKLWITPASQQNCEIHSYTGEIKLSEFSEFQCNLVLYPFGQKEATFRLDEVLKIESISYRDNPVTYRRSGDYVTVELPDADSDSIALSFKYEGRLYYKDDIERIYIFTAEKSSSLPPRFSFLPVIDGDQTSKDYDLTVSAHNSVISNLDVTQEKKDVFKLTGNSRTCCIYCGYFTEHEENGIVYYYEKYNRQNDYEKAYQDLMRTPVIDTWTFERKDYSASGVNKIFFLYSAYLNYGFPLQYDDYILYGT